MKKAILIFFMAALLFLSGLYPLVAQDEPKPKKDTVNMDTDAKPTFYYAEEDEKSGSKGNSGGGSGSTAAIIGGVVLLLAVAGYFLLRKKKQ